MPTTSISPRYRITLPKELREKIGLLVGDRVSFLRRGDEIIIVKVPNDPLRTMAGALHTNKDVRKLLKELKEEELIAEGERGN